MELFPDYLFLEIDRAEIDFMSYSRPGSGVVFQNRLYILGKEDSEDVQIMAFLHELFHFHPNFMSYTGGIWQGTFRREEDIESQIEAMAVKIFETRLDVVNRVKDKLNKAKQ